MVYTDTLVIKNLPGILSNQDKQNLFKYFGALNIRILNSSSKKTSTAFVKFESPEIANAVLLRLHQKELLGYKLVVQFADSKNTTSDNTTTDSNRKSNENNCYEEFLKELNSWTKGINFKLSPPCHLKYRYPAPTPTILYNISNMLVSVPKFYTQVLHLMNKMNLPCPLEPDFPVENNKMFDLFLSHIYEEKLKEKALLNDESSSEFESELESDNDRKNNQDAPTIKRKVSRKKKIYKRAKIPKPITGSLTSSNKTVVNIEDIFETTNQEKHQKKIEMNVPERINEIAGLSNTGQKENAETEVSGFGILYPVKKVTEQDDETKNEQSVDKNCISAEKLAANRIPMKDRATLPIFKNYQAGNPSCRLYIKNLSKHVTREDLLYIYNRYFIEGIDEQGTMFDIRLMQEGRMKGQAFVTLQDVKQARLALEETNGYILKDKPMVVQFARSAVTK